MPSSLHREFFVYFKKNKSNGKLARAKKRENLIEISGFVNRPDPCCTFSGAKHKHRYKSDQISI